MLIFYQISRDEDSPGWHEIGRIKDGEIIEDETGDFEDWIGEQRHYPEEHLARQYDNHYINAVLIEEDDQ